jgi:hypothetical protein
MQPHVSTITETEIQFCHDRAWPEEFHLTMLESQKSSRGTCPYQTILPEREAHRDDFEASEGR